MKPSHRITVFLGVQFSQRSHFKPVHADLGRDRALSVNILRGRITQEESSFDLEVTGPAQRIEALIRLISVRGASVATSTAGVA